MDVICQLAEKLSGFAPAADLSNDSGWGYLRKVRDYLLNYDDAKTGADLATTYVMNSPSVMTGSGAKVIVLDLVGQRGKSIINGFASCDESIREMLKKQELMDREPGLRAFLRFADLQFRLSDREDLEPQGVYSDAVTDSVNALFSQIKNIPTAEQLADMQQNDPQSYETAMKIIGLMNAYTDYYYPDPEIEADEAAKLDAEQLRQQKIEKLKALNTAVKNFEAIDEQTVRQFLINTGNEDGMNWCIEHMYSEKVSTNIHAASAQLDQQLMLLDTGLSLDEQRLITDFYKFMKNAKGEMFGKGGYKFDDMYEPLKTSGTESWKLAQEGMEKLKTGFQSEEEKNEYFERLCTVSEKLSDDLMNMHFNDYSEDLPDYNERMPATAAFWENTKQQAASKYGAIYHAITMKERKTSLGNISKWMGRVELNPCYAALKNSGTKYLGDVEKGEYKSYKSMMGALHDATRISLKNNQNEKTKELLADKCQIAVEQGCRYLDKVFAKKPEEMNAMSAKELAVLQDRAVGIIGFMKSLSPHKAEAYRTKATALFGENLTWNEVTARTKDAYDRKPNYMKYYELHTKQNAQNIPDKRLAEYTAKAASALMYVDDANKKFVKSIPRSHAETLMKAPEFIAAVKAYGPDGMREALTSGDPKKIATIVRGSNERYAVNGQTKAKLQALSERMNKDHRSKEWGALKDALANGNMKDSRKVFDAIEGYVKGKKKVSSDPQRKESIKIALDALAIVAENGDNVAKTRAQILIDRFNTVNKATEPGSRNHIDLSNYGKDILPAAQNAAEHQQNIVNQV